MGILRGYVGETKEVYLRSLGTIRSVISRAGSARAVTNEDLAACRADLLVIQQTVERVSEADPVLAQFFMLSDDVAALIERIAGEEASEAGRAVSTPPAPRGDGHERPAPQTAR